ncbi:MAG: DUF3179 domain-containing protein [Pseudomonadota bacterium]
MRLITRWIISALLCWSVSAVALAEMPGDVPGRWKSAWPETDFSKISVDPGEVFSGGPPRDGIPAITGPVMIDVAAEDRIGLREPVMSIALPGEVPRAYPVRYLMWHEIVNDRVGDLPIAVTFCPLCNSGLVFDRRVEGQVLELGVSGLLRFSDMIMYDRTTFSWWQQFTGEAIAGTLTGAELTALPALLESWEAFSTRHPDGLVMDEPADHRRPYGTNPYEGYDQGTPFLYRGPPPPHSLHPLSRVVRVGARAWPLARLRDAGRLEEASVILTWEEGQASALSTSDIDEGREVGTVRVTAPDGTIVVHEVVFAFAFHAFTPDGVWMLGD